MSIPVIKAITKRIRLRLGSTENAALAAGVSKSVWSDYENPDKPESSIPFHRLIAVADQAERRAFAALLSDDAGPSEIDVMDEAAEATEAVAALQAEVRLASKDGVICETDRRSIRARILAAQDELQDVMRGVA